MRRGIRWRSTAASPTGSPAACCSLPPILAGLLWLLDRWQLSRGSEFKSGLPMRFGWLVALAYLGTLTHPFLDLLTTYSVQLFSPLSSAWYHSDALFIIDIWVWLLLAIAIGISKRREQQGTRMAAHPAGGDRDPARLHRRQPRRSARRPMRDVRAADPRAQAIFASPPPVPVVAPRPRLARRRALLPRQLRSARRRLPPRLVRAVEHERSAASAKRSGATRACRNSSNGRSCRRPT